MEIILNLAWGLCSLGLVWLWLRPGAGRDIDPRRRGQVSRRTQMLALAMVVVLLLPVISLSDDLAAAQGLAETDSCLRRATNVDAGQTTVVPTTLDMPEACVLGLVVGETLTKGAESDRLMLRPSLVTRALDSRPPPARG